MGNITGMATAMRLAWRRSRVFWTCWIVGIASVLPATVSKYHELVPADPREAQVFFDGLGSNPTMRALLGPPFDLTAPGPFTFWRVGTFAAAAAAMMAALGVIRATRAEEEEGRVELVRAGAVGRFAPLAAGVAVACLGSTALAAVCASLLALAGTPIAGAFAAGLGIGATALMFAGVGAVFAQLFESARTARSWAVGLTLGGLYLARAIVDGSGPAPWTETARWFMPLDWAALVQPYVANRWWVLLLPLVTSAVLVGTAFVLEARRDHGSGYIVSTPGHAEAPASLSGPIGLAWRLHRPSVIGWTVGIVVSAVAMGSLATSIDSLLQENAQLAEMFRRMGANAQVLTDSFYIAMLGIMVTLVGVFASQILGRLRSEESRGHAEPVLATATSRVGYAASHLWLAIVVPIALLVILGWLLPLAGGAEDVSATMVTFAKAAAALVPGVVLVVGVAMALIGWRPSWYGVTWALLGWTMFVSWLGPLFALPQWLLQLHPWGHLPHLPTDPFTWTVVVVETALGVGLIALGLIGYRRRNIPSV